MNPTLQIHGGADALGVPLHDFSTNSNACGPCPSALAALQQADATRYPDPGYTDLHARLADFHGVDVARIVLAGSASEFVFRMSARFSLRGRRQSDHTVFVQRHAYGDYAHAARAWGLNITTQASVATLVWWCEPSSPLGISEQVQALGPHGVLVLDCAYAPLRLSGASAFTVAQRALTWQLFSPNKALGLTGLRAAYAIAPVGAESEAAALRALAPSWVIGAHGVALLQAWTQPDAQAWLSDSLHTLRQWKARQKTLLDDVGWSSLPSDANFFCAQPIRMHGDKLQDDATLATLLRSLRALGIKLRDATSFELPGWARLGVQTPHAQDALRLALQQCLARPPARMETTI